MKKNQTLFLDMDGVLADFDAAAKEFLQASDLDLEQARKNNKWTRTQWEQIKEHNPRFYLTLPKTAFADQLVAEARKFRDTLNWQLKILTAIPSGNDMPWAFYDKILWQQQYYPDIPVMFGPYSKDKYLHCKTSGDILIDDRYSNCQAWREATGIAIQMKTLNPEPSLTILKEIFVNQTQL
jgi:hypothetical protein